MKGRKIWNFVACGQICLPTKMKGSSLGCFPILWAPPRAAWRTGKINKSYIDSTLEARVNGIISREQTFPFSFFAHCCVLHLFWLHSCDIHIRSARPALIGQKNRWVKVVCTIFGIYEIDICFSFPPAMKSQFRIQSNRLC